MMKVEQLPVLAVISLSFVVAVTFTSILVAVTTRMCRSYGWLAQPRNDRWHKGTPAMFGGVPLWLGFILSCAFLLPRSNHLVWFLLAVSSLMFFFGLVDDLAHLQPRSKILLQLMSAALLMSCGVIYPLRPNLLINVIFSIVWIVGITNAFNLLDNMDGLSAGTALIVSLYLIIFYTISNSPQYALLVAIAAGSIAGFLLFNFNPARIFMGDCGSLFIGFFLGSVSLLQVTHISGVANFVLGPMAVLAIPIFDTLFVSVTRRLRGQPVSVGGTDHSSHRLVSLGLSERKAVFLLYFLAAASGTAALAARKLFWPYAVGLVSSWYLLLLLFGIHLFRGDDSTHEHSPFSKSWLKYVFHRDTLAFLLDPLALTLAYYLAYFFRFRISVPHSEISIFLRSLPIVLSAKIAALFVFKIYRHSWWRGSIGDAFRLARATVFGEVVIVLVLTGLYRFNGYSRVVFVVDCALSWILLLGVRKSFFLFRESVRMWASEKPAQGPVFVLGTSENAELALRFLRDRRILCAGLIDTNGGGDLNRRVWGAQVVGRLDELTVLASRYGVTSVILPENEALPCSEAEFHSRCRHDKLQVMKLGLYAANPNTTGPKALSKSATGTL
jgi:UDP-GlcNAc:undecaprenyl-phosphate/decaprenyl-phosphate GlcNAc-1-phosphate transferase